MANYISLQEASKFCKYSQEYLSLRARQGKLQAVKVGRNWVTTKEWLQEYIARAERYRIKIKPRLNLPIYALPADTPHKNFQKKFQFAFATAMVAALLVVGMVQGRQSIWDVANDVSPPILFAVHAVQANMQEAGIGELLDEYAGWLGKSARDIAGWFGLFDHERDHFAASPPPPAPAPLPVPRSGKQGMVLIPSSEHNEQVKEQIRQSFSDEVVVTPADEQSGIITPVFRDRTGEDYLYILVPLQERE